MVFPGEITKVWIQGRENSPKFGFKATLLWRRGMIIGMGNSLLDLIGHVCEDVLDKHGLVANNGYLAEDKHMPLFKDLIEKYKANYVVGGSVQNSLRVTQWVLGVPNVCIIFGAIGSDEPGGVLVRKAIADGVDTQYQYIEDTPTGVCGVLLTKGGAERTLLANLSAANCFTIDHLQKPENQERLKEAEIVYVSGFFLSVNVQAILYAAKVACEGNKWFVMNLSASFLAEQYMERWCQVMPYVDLLFGNETEARTFAEQQQFNELHDVHKIALELSCLPKSRQTQQRIVVITQGCDPVVVAKDGETKEYPVLQLSREQVVDSTGAGDAFVGGFLAQMVQAAPLEECISCGIWCATQMVQQQGCSLENLVKYTSAQCQCIDRS